MGIVARGGGGARDRRLARGPGFRVVGERVNRLRQSPVGQIRERHVLDDLPKVLAQRDPDALQRLGGAVVGDRLPPLPPPPPERTLHPPGHVGGAHLRPPPGPPGPPPRPPPAPPPPRAGAAPPGRCAAARAAAARRSPRRPPRARPGPPGRAGRRGAWRGGGRRGCPRAPRGSRTRRRRG